MRFHTAAHAILTALCALHLPVASLAAQDYTAENPLVLKMTSFAMPTHALIKNGVYPWAENLKDMSGGRLVVELYNPGTVCPDADVYECVKSGVIDLGLHLTQRVKGVFPLSNVVDLPFLFPSSEAATSVFTDLLKEFPELRAEFDETRLFGVTTSVPVQLHTVSRPIKTIAEVKGLKSGATAVSDIPVLQSLGAAAVSVPLTDCYLALQRGQMDSIMSGNAFVISSKIYEATKYTTILNSHACGFYLCMNRQTYDAMPEDLKAILDASLDRERFHQWSIALDEGGAEDLEAMQAAGQQIFSMPEEEILKGRELCKPVVEAWIKECTERGKGDAARKLYARALELAQEYQNSPIR